MQYYPIYILEVLEKGYIQKQEKALLIEKEKERKKKMKDPVIQEMISKADKTTMKRILSACLKIDAKEIKGIDKIVEEWAVAKKDLYLLLNKNLRITVEKEYSLDTHEQILKIKELLKKYPCEKFFIEQTSMYPEIADNKLSDSYALNYAQNYYPNFAIGMKFTQFAHDFFKNDKFDNDLSMFYEKTKTTGYISISIDPVDYMLMSLNNSGWHSCHSLHEGSGVSYGSYSAGVFSYMCDNVSIIAFRHSQNENEDIIINRTKIKALNKNWRQMVYIDLDKKFFACSREYPQDNETVAQCVREMIEELIASKYEMTNKWLKKAGNVSEYITNTPKANDSYDSTLHYNDLRNGRNGVLIYRDNIGNYKNTQIAIGSFPICPICGESILNSHNMPMCRSCYERR